MDKKFFKNEDGYIQATIALMVTILLSYMIFIFVMPVGDALVIEFTPMLEGNQFYTQILEERMFTAQDFGWKMPFMFIGIGVIYIFVRTIIRQRYTRYANEEY